MIRLAQLSGSKYLTSYDSGKFSIFSARSFATRSALSHGIRTSIVNLVVRSTSVATCDAFAFPMIKSPPRNPAPPDPRPPPPAR